MDINMMRSVLTVLAFISFVGIVWWAYRARSQKGFEEAARLPFADTVIGQGSPATKGTEK